MKTAHTGTLESMDCIVTAAERETGSGVVISITGSSAARFKTAVEKEINRVLASLSISDLDIAVQDNGASDLVLGARVEAAVKKLSRGAVR